MAKSTVPRHSKTPRKPVTIDLDPSDVKPVSGAGPEKPEDAVASRKPVSAAEPVGDFAKSQQPTPNVKSPETSRSSPSAGVADAHPSISASLSEKAMNSAPKSTSPWLAGLAGGVIVLLGITALQWSGLGIFATQNNNTSDLSAQVTKLEQQLSALQAAPVAKPDADLLARLAIVEKNAAEAQKLISELPQASALPVTSDDSDLRAELTQRLNDLETKLNTTHTQAEQANAALSAGDTAVNVLKDQLSALQSKIEGQASQPDMSAIIAVNALKSAIDRGGSYTNEYQTYISLLPQKSSVAASLEALAPTGVPTLSQLNTQFPALADQMVAAENKPAADAGVWDQLVGSAKGLVRSRPVGDIAGTDVGPVIARVEFALQNGDTERAMAEWAQLPESAKLVGQSFYNALAARRDADALISRLITETAQPEAKSKPAAK